MSTADHSAKEGAPVVVVGGDDAFALGMAVTISGALSTLDDEATVYVLDGGISLANAERIRALVARVGPRARLEWLRLDLASHTVLPERGRLSKATCLRLLIPELLPTSVTRALYLDSDVLVMESVDELWRMDMQGHAVAAVPDMGVETLGQAIVTHERQGVPAGARYFNSGVLLMDLARWRAEAIGARVIENVVANVNAYRYLDQDGLNVALWDDWEPLPAPWNVQVGSRAMQQAAVPVRDAQIAHFTGIAKPWSDSWRLSYGDALDGYREAFFAELRRSGWFSPSGYRWFRARIAAGEARVALGETLPVRAVRYAARQMGTGTGGDG